MIITTKEIIITDQPLQLHLDLRFDDDDKPFLGFHAFTRNAFKKDEERLTFDDFAWIVDVWGEIFATGIRVDEHNGLMGRPLERHYVSFDEIELKRLEMLDVIQTAINEQVQFKPTLQEVASETADRLEKHLSRVKALLE